MTTELQIFAIIVITLVLVTLAIIVNIIAIFSEPPKKDQEYLHIITEHLVKKYLHCSRKNESVYRAITLLNALSRTRS